MRLVIRNNNWCEIACDLKCDDAKVLNINAHQNAVYSVQLPIWSGIRSMYINRGIMCHPTLKQNFEVDQVANVLVS